MTQDSGTVTRSVTRPVTVRAPLGVTRRRGSTLRVQPEVAIGDDAGRLLEGGLGVLDQRRGAFGHSAELRAPRVEGGGAGRIGVGNGRGSADGSAGRHVKSGRRRLMHPRGQGEGLGELVYPVTAGSWISSSHGADCMRSESPTGIRVRVVTFDEMEAALRSRLEASRWRPAPSSSTSFDCLTSTEWTRSAPSGAIRRLVPSESC
jgi:hypothetical protein